MYLHHQKFFLDFLFPTVGKNIPSGRCSKLSGSLYDNNVSTVFLPLWRGPSPPQRRILFFSLWRVLTLPHCPVSRLPQPPERPRCSLHEHQYEAFLSIPYDVLSILSRSCRLVSGFFIPILHYGSFHRFFLEVRPFGMMGAISSLICF
jgi:hypothetical protein